MSNSVETDVTSSKSQQLECEEKQEHRNVQLQTTTKNIKTNNENLAGSNENLGNDMKVTEETEEKRQLLANSEMKGAENDLQIQKSLSNERKVGHNVVLLPRKNSSMDFSASVGLISDRSSEKGNMLKLF